MDFINALQQESYVSNTKGGMYYKTTFNSNLDLFSFVSRYQSETEIKSIFNAAYLEDRKLALANLLYLLDIKEGYKTV